MIGKNVFVLCPAELKRLLEEKLRADGTLKPCDHVTGVSAEGPNKTSLDELFVTIESDEKVPF